MDRKEEECGGSFEFRIFTRLPLDGQLLRHIKAKNGASSARAHDHYNSLLSFNISQCPQIRIQFVSVIQVSSALSLTRMALFDRSLKTEEEPLGGGDQGTIATA